MKNIFYLILLLFLINTTMFSQTNEDSLYQAVVDNDTSAIKHFVQNGADVNFIKQQGWVKINLLITAVNKGNADAVRTLLQYGANVNWEDGFNSTALMYAANIGNIEIVKLLLDKGADIKHKDKQGNDAISVAKQAKHTNIVNLLEEKLE